MSIQRDRPYMQFNFLVDLGSGTDGPDAAFQEISNLGTEFTVAEYRAGNDKENNVRKYLGLNKAADVTLKRGIVGYDSFYKWLEQVRRGDKDATKASIQIMLQSEAHETVMTWSLKNARILKYISGPFNAKGTDVAMEELTIAYEQLVLEA
jgi:phage tail-like protein